MFVHLTMRSRNSKTGPIPVSTTSADTCPVSCPFKNNGCYADSGPLKLHWDRVSHGQRGSNWRDFLAAVRAMPEGQLWRHNQAGDLPGQGDTVDANQLRQLVRANRGKRGFTYTHKPLTERTANLLREALREGFTINASTNSLAHADRMADQEPGVPLVTVVDDAAPAKGYTPNGRRYLVCPAQEHDDVSCATCGLCQNDNPNRPIIAFRPHGRDKKRVIAHILEAV